MKYKIPGYGWLKVNESERKKITSQTGQAAFVKSHYADILKESSALKQVVSKLKNVETIADAMAGCGFSVAVLKSVFPDSKLILNDWDKQCYENLKLNFPESSIANEDINKWELWGKVDLLFIDFNNFTLKRIDDWKPTILRLSEKCKNLIITDSACFGFRMGNLKTYGVETPAQYYGLLEKELGLKEKSLTHFSIFGNAALVLFQPLPKYGVPHPIKEVKWEPLKIWKAEDNSLLS